MGYNVNAEWDREMDGQVRFHRFRYHLAKGFVELGDKVLDIGCGTGYGTEMLSETASLVTGIDIDQPSIDACKVKHGKQNINFICADLENYELPECTVAVQFENLEHLKDPKKFVEQLKKKTRKFIIMSVPLGQQLEFDAERGYTHEVGDHTHLSVFPTEQSVLELFLDDVWGEFYSLRIGVTFIAVFYDKDSR